MALVTAIPGAVAGGNLVLILLDMVRAGSKGVRSPAIRRRTRSRRMWSRTHRPVPVRQRGGHAGPRTHQDQQISQLHGRLAGSVV